MPIGLNLLCLAAHVEEAHAPHLERLAALGYDGVEIPVLRGEPEHYRRLGARLDGLGLRRTVTAVIPGPEASPVSDDPEARAPGRRAPRLGRRLRGGAGGRGRGRAAPRARRALLGGGPHRGGARPGGRVAPAPRGRRRAGRRLRRDGAAEPLRGLSLQHCRAGRGPRRPGGPPRLPRHARHLPRQHRGARPGRGGEDAGAAARRAARLGERPRRRSGRGQIDFEAVFRAAKGVGFDGWLVVEAFGAGLPELAAATRVWRPLFPDHGTLYAESLAAVRHAWAAA